MTNSRHITRVFFIFIALAISSKLKAQDTSIIEKEFYYRLTLAGGIGSGVPQEEGSYGISSNIEFAVQKERNVYALGIRQTIEFNLFLMANVQNSVSSVDLTYGKAYSKKRFYASVSTGLGFVTTVQRGDFISREGGWLFGYSTYEKLQDNTVGIPVTVKAFWVPAKFYGIGLELYANLNLKNSFFGINMGHQLGKLRAGRKK